MVPLMPAHDTSINTANDHTFMPPHIPAIRIDDTLAHAISHALSIKTKPPGSLGGLEALSAQIARVQGRIAPRIEHAQAIVFAADHGIVAEGVSAYPAAVTAQMVHNFLSGGAAICVLARQFGAALTVVDAGVAATLPMHPQLLDRKIALGTENFLHTPAMTRTQCLEALEAGIAIGRQYAPHGAMIFGEMGIGNTTSAAALMHASTGLPVDECIGRGTGIDDAGLQRKRNAIDAAVAHHASSKIITQHDALDALACFGGFEIAMMTGAMLGAAQQRQVIVVDGFIATAAVAIGITLAPDLFDYCVFAHVSAEAPHRRWLQHLGARPLLDLGLRLGEGSGAMLALPLLHAACAILCDMATFESAGVSDRSDAAAQ